ncbi:MAG: Tex-like N-terminal domain-containing protein [Thermoguttaceae bacterium]
MTGMVTIDLRQVARGLDIPLRQIQATVELLDEGNTVPFITRYRKDQTGGLDEEEVRLIQDRLAKMRLLAERKQTILRSIESQQKLTEKLAKQILAATTTKRLEDLYLPYKPKKQTLATNARNRGLEELAREILDANPLSANLDARAKDYANPDRQVPTAADALLGAGHIIAELFSEQAELRQRLREIVQRSGVIVTTRIAPEPKASTEKTEKPERVAAAAATTFAAPTRYPPGTVHSAVTEAPPQTPGIQPLESAHAQPPARPEEHHHFPSSAIEAVPSDQYMHIADSASAAPSPADAASAPERISSIHVTTPHGQAQSVSVAAANEVVSAVDSIVSLEHSGRAEGAEPLAGSQQDSILCQSAGPAEPLAVSPGDSLPQSSLIISSPAAPTGSVLPTASTADQQGPALTAAQRKQLARQKAKQAQSAKREQMKKNLEEKRIKSFRDYFDYREEIKKIPPHRVLAINRGERARVLRVKIETDLQAMVNAVEEFLVPPNHPHADYLRGCARDSLSRLILSSLEREARRELTDRAEAHAVGVFAKNLRNLLLHPPVHNHRVLALDPGYKSGCKLAALDQFGNLLEHAVIYLIGKPELRDSARQKLVDLVKKHQLTVVTIGNGTACREAEKFVSDVLGGELKEQGTAYVIVNEAGASVYSTSRLGREEFPDYDASLRGAISIGRRLQDPLSELVKIDPANIGVGLYQHDVKAKHLRTSLDDVVESCVNYVGVDVNTASPALLRYVSGLNQLTAHRLYEYRREHGPFKNREQFRQVPGLGEATFVQAAGFLKISAGDNPLDTTWIHPESYPVANRVLQRLECTPNDLTDKTATAALAERATKVDLDAMAKELEVGSLSLKDILAHLARPGRDPREDLPPPVFKHGVLKLEDLSEGMELTGTVLNVVDFGCFVDIGMHDSGLVHVSHMADRFIRDPHEVATVGDVVKVWVLAVDKERRRVSLTMVQPGTERPRPPRHGHKPEHGAKPEGAGAAGANVEGTKTQTAKTGGGADRRDQNRDKFTRRDRGQQNRPPRGDRPPQGDRPPREQAQQPSDARSNQRRSQSSRPRTHGQNQPRSKPKPIIPITDAMKEGKEPMRTFADLAQFYQQKKQPETPQKPTPQTPEAKDEQPAASAETPPAADQAMETIEQAPVSNNEGQAAAASAEISVQNDETALQNPQPDSPGEGV